MVTVRPFAAIRPEGDSANQVIAPPYDVLSRAEAARLADGRPNSFLRISRSEIDLPEIEDPYDPLVYLQARTNLEQFITDGVLVRDSEPTFSIYRQTMAGRSQTGLVATVSLDEYEAGLIKRHEHTTVEKEDDRIRHFDATDANTEPIFLTYRDGLDIVGLLESWIALHGATIDLTTPDGVRHEVWIVDSGDSMAQIVQAFAGIPALYIADGHHRAASAAKVGALRREQNPGYSGTEEFNYVMAVIFPASQLTIFDYNRAIRDRAGGTAAELLESIAEDFQIAAASASPYRPQRRGQFGMFLGGRWYVLQAKSHLTEVDDPVAGLDVAILQDHLLAPWLRIADPRTDQRIKFIGGIRGLEALEQAAGVDGVAFAVYPVLIDDLLQVADAGQVMPPKSTWFEPKLASGLFLHDLAD